MNLYESFKRNLKEASNEEKISTDANISKVAKFLEQAVNGLIEDDTTNSAGGCYRYILDSNFAIYVGWSAGWGKEPRDDVYQSKVEPDYAIEAAVKIRNDSDWADYDYLDFPWYEDGEVYNYTVSLKPDSNFTQDAKYLLDSYKEIRQGYNNGELFIESAKLKESDNINNLVNELREAGRKGITEFGFEENDFDDFFSIKRTDEPDYTLIYFLGELDYNEGTNLIDKYLNPVLQKYFEDAYFEAEDTGRWVAYIDKDMNESEILNEDIEKLEPRFDSRASFYGKAKVDTNGEERTLISYSTPILKVKGNNIEWLINKDDTWALSQTTLRHIKDFLKQMSYDYDLEVPNVITKSWIINQLPEGEPLDESVSINGVTYYRVLDESGNEYFSLDKDNYTTTLNENEKGEVKYPIITKALKKLVDINELENFNVLDNGEIVISYSVQDTPSTDRSIYVEDDSVDTLYNSIIKSRDDLADDFYGALQDENDFYGYDSKEELDRRIKAEEFVLTKIAEELNLIKDEVSMNDPDLDINSTTSVEESVKDLKESSTVIWSSESTEDDYDPAWLQEQYQDYVDSFDGTINPDSYEEWLDSDWLYNYLRYDFEEQEDYTEWYDFINSYDEEDLKRYYQDYLDDIKEREPRKPTEFEEWKENYIIDDSPTQWELKEEDLKENIYPMIDNQINNDILIVSGNYNSNYPEFRKSGAGGKLLNKAEDLLDWLSNEDRVDITNNDGILGISAYDHDGSIGGNLYTLPDDDNLLLEIAKSTGYYDEDEEDEILDNFKYDLTHDSIDMRDLRDYADKFIPIKVNW